MQLTNELLLLLGVAAIAINPLSDRLAATIAGAFARLDRALQKRRHVARSGHHAVRRGAVAAAKSTPCVDGCG